jgi:hypothetical protein
MSTTSRFSGKYGGRPDKADVARRLSEGMTPGEPAWQITETPEAKLRGGTKSWIAWLVFIGIGVLLLVFFAGCSPRNAAGPASASSTDFDCSRTAACLPSMVSDEVHGSGEGARPGTRCRAEDQDFLPKTGLSTSAGGAASEPESSGTGRAERDRRGLVDAWPEVGPSSHTSRSVPASPVAPT